MYVRCNIVESIGDKLAVISDALFRAIAPDLISASSFKEARIDLGAGFQEISDDSPRYSFMDNLSIKLLNSRIREYKNIL